MKNIFSILFLMTTFTTMGQNMFNDSIKMTVKSELEKRLPEKWVVAWDADTLEVSLVDTNGIYRYVGDAPFFENRNKNFNNEKALLRWYKTDYLVNNPDYAYASDTFTIAVDFATPWTQSRIDAMKKSIDSASSVIKTMHVKQIVCDNYFWNSSKSKQVLPFYSGRLNCSCFFDDGTMYRRGDPMVVQYENGIPRLVEISDEVFMIKQIMAMTLGINEYCFECRCKQ
jgi:hypothetical protein